MRLDFFVSLPAVQHERGPRKGKNKDVNGSISNNNSSTNGSSQALSHVSNNSINNNPSHNNGYSHVLGNNVRRLSVDSPPLPVDHNSVIWRPWNQHMENSLMMESQASPTGVIDPRLLLLNRFLVDHLIRQRWIGYNLSRN